MVEKIGSKEYLPNFDQSFYVTYDSINIKSIFTPLNYIEKSTIEAYHICFVKEDSLFSSFALILCKEVLDDSNFQKYTFKSINDENIGQFVINNEGIITDIIPCAPIGWFEQFENCLNWTFDQMNIWDQLACMAFGSQCAATIALACAFGATEGYFPNN